MTNSLHDDRNPFAQHDADQEQLARMQGEIDHLKMQMELLQITLVGMKHFIINTNPPAAFPSHIIQGIRNE